MIDEIETLVMALSQAVARDIMACGDEPQRPCTRIQFMSKLVTDEEIAQGGLCETALAGVIHRSLRDRLGT